MTVTAPAVSKWRVADSERDSASSDGRDRGGGEGHRHVHPQHPFPAEAVGEDAAEQDARGAAGAGDGAPDAERLVALGAVAERRRDDRERGRRDDRGAEALGRAGGDQLGFVRREAGGERRRGDEQEPGDEHPPSAEQVGQAPAEQQEAAEGEDVGVHHPGEVLLREVERLADRGQGDVHDRGVKDDDELGCREQHQRDPAPVMCSLYIGHLSSFRVSLRRRTAALEMDTSPVKPGKVEAVFRFR